MWPLNTQAAHKLAEGLASFGWRHLYVLHSSDRNARDWNLQLTRACEQHEPRLYVRAVLELPPVLNQYTAFNESIRIYVSALRMLYDASSVGPDLRIGVAFVNHPLPLLIAA
jgi:hypothetical protein